MSWKLAIGMPVIHALGGLLLLGTSLAAGCADRRPAARLDDTALPVRGGTLEVVGGGDVDHLTTTSGYVSPTLWLFRMFARQLLTYPHTSDEPGRTRLVPDLALEVPTPKNGGINADGLIYTFHLRHGVHWSSSPPREVSAHDVVRAFKLLCNPVSPVSTPGYYTDTIAGMAAYCHEFSRVPGTVEAIREFVDTHDLDGVRADDDFTVVFHLLVPASDFPNLVAPPFASPVPAEYLDYLPDSPKFRQHTLSDVPYRITRYVQNREMVLERNPVWDAATDPLRPAYVDGIHLRLGFDDELKYLQIEAGIADLMPDAGVPRTELPSLLENDDPTVWLLPPGNSFLGLYYLVLNFAGVDEALRQLHVRRAIALAVDKAAIVQLLGGPRTARALRQAVPSSASGYRDGADQYVTPGDHGDSTAARALLADAGCTRLTLSLAYATNNGLMAQTLQASLGRAGKAVRLLPMPPADLYGRFLTNPEVARRGEWNLVLVNAWPDWFGGNNGRSFVPVLFDGRHLGQNTANFGGYQNAEVDAAIDIANTAPTAERADKAWSDAARLVMDHVALVPLVEYKCNFARSRRVRNCAWTMLGLDCDPTTLWLSDAERKAAGSR